MRTCVAGPPAGPPCGATVAVDAPIALCPAHLLVAHDWVMRDVGVTDLLPSPCLSCGSRVGVRYPVGWICADCEWRVGEVPDLELAAAPLEVVYYVRFDERIKIGTTRNPRGRFAALPVREVLAFERGGRALERRRHQQFAAHRIPRTEWFERSAELDAHVAALREGVDDPWVQHARWVAALAALHG